MPTPPPGDACGSCLHGRREFLHEALGLAAASLAALGLLPGDAAALSLPLRFVAALRAEGTERRYALPAADGVAIDKAEALMIARAGNKVFAFSLACPHQNTALRWRERDRRFECPKHHSKYQPDGTFISGRATRSLDRYAVRRDGGELVVRLDALLREDRDRFRWTAAVVLL